MFMCEQCEKPASNNPKMLKNKDTFLSGHKSDKPKEEKDLTAEEFNEKFREKINRKKRR